MPGTDFSWRGKIRALLDRRGESVPVLAKRIGRSERTVRSWLDAERREPLRERATVEQMAVALGVTADWLFDGQPGDPPQRAAQSADIESLARRVPARVKRLIFALADPLAVDFLLAQLDIYERVRPQPRRRGPA